MPPNEITRKLVVRAIAQHELDLIVGPERLQILDRKSIGLARVGTLHVHDLDDLHWHTRQGSLAAGLKQNLVAAVEQLLHKRNHFLLLQHRFAARDLDESTTRAQGNHLVEDFFPAHFAPAVETEFAVAPGAAKIASGQTHEDARESGVRRFALQGSVNLGDG